MLTIYTLNIILYNIHILISLYYYKHECFFKYNDNKANFFRNNIFRRVRLRCMWHYSLKILLRYVEYFFKLLSIFHFCLVIIILREHYK